MTFAYRMTAGPGPWVEPDALTPTTVGGTEARRGWFDGLAEEDLAEYGMERGEIVETDPPAGRKATGATLEDVNGVPTRVWASEDHTADEVAVLKAQKVAEVTAEAARRTAEIMGQGAMCRSLARALALVTTLGPDPADWPSDARTRHLADVEAWAAVEAIDAAADAITAAIPEDAAGIVAFDVAAAAWPQGAN